MKNNVYFNLSSTGFTALTKRSSALAAFRAMGMLVGLLLLACLMGLVQPAVGQRKMENLGRGVVAIRSSASQVFVSWRLLGTEPTTLAFNVYRKAGSASAVKLNAAPLTAGTNWQDNSADFSVANAYYVRAVVNGAEQTASASFTLRANAAVEPFYSIPLQNLPDYFVKFIWVGDLDGDGEYDFVFDRQPNDATKTIVVEAYKRDGTFLWRIDCGPNSVNKYNISPGSSAIDIGHGDGITVYDINNDGKAEVLLKTSNGVKFGNGTVLSNSDNSRQFISVVEGLTGREITRAPVPTDYLSIGPLNGHFGIAYLDGVNPSIVFSGKNRNADKSFNMIVAAWTWSNGSLVQNWRWLRPSEGNIPDGHNIRCIDLDGDGKDEVFPMGFALRPNGTLLYTLGNQGVVHGDRFHIGDLDPDRPGVEGYVIQQDNISGLFWAYFDGKTGAILKSQVVPGEIKDLARGCALDLDPRYRGYEFYTFTDGLYNVSGTKTSTALPASYPNMRFWWDGDLLGEMLDNGKFTKWNYLNSTEGRLYTASGVNQIGPKTPGFYGDIMGDWREEVVYTASDNQSIRVYTTPLPTTTRLYTLAHNPAYRNCMTNKGYYQSNMIDYYLGDSMSTPPRPNITIVNGGGSSSGITSGATYTITVRHSGKNLDVTSQSIENGARVIQNAPSSSTSQRWVVSSTGDGYYTIRALHSNRGLDVMSRSLSDGTAIQQYGSGGSSHQQFAITGGADGYYNIVARHSSKCLNILDASSADGAALVQWTCEGGTNQQFRFTPVSGSRMDDHPAGNVAIRIYPSPTSSNFTIKAKGRFTYKIHNQVGKELGEGTGQDQVITGAYLKPGVYVVTVKTLEGSQAIKVVKQ